jgi:hypothetical protein
MCYPCYITYIVCLLTVNISPLFLFEGKDDASRNTASAVDDVAVSSTLESEDFVAIKIDSGSEAYTQFAQICILYAKYLKCD